LHVLPLLRMRRSSTPFLEHRAPERLTSNYRNANDPGLLTGGDKGDRTPDLVNAIHALSQLSYIPVLRRGFLLVGACRVKPRGRLGPWRRAWGEHRRGACSRRG